MSTSSDGLGAVDPAPGAQPARARTNASRPFGDGRLQGARSGRDVTVKPREGTAPSPPPRPRHEPPAQPCGNPHGPHASPLAVRRTGTGR
jgi:hypothetical protein